MTAHATGPWTVEYGESALGKFWMVVTSKGFAVHYSPLDGDDEDRAIAYLIAAAPQQQDALLAVLHAPGFVDLDDATKNAVRAAITRAAPPVPSQGTTP